MGADLGLTSLAAIQEEAARLLAPRAGTSRSTAWTGTGRPQLIGDLTLFSYPLLVDEGRLVEGAAELKEALEEEAFAELHPDDADKRGLADGDRASVRTGRGEATLPVLRVPSNRAGRVFVPFNQPGLAANTLLSGRRVRRRPSASEPADAERSGRRARRAVARAVGTEA